MFSGGIHSFTGFVMSSLFSSVFRDHFSKLYIHNHEFIEYKIYIEFVGRGKHTSPREVAMKPIAMGIYIGTQNGNTKL